MRGILTLSNYNSAHTSCFTIIIYKSYAVATLQYSRPFISINYACIVAFAPYSQRASFWGVIMSLYYSTTIKLLPLIKLITGSYPSLRTPLRCWEVIISLVSTMVLPYANSMQGRHAGQYLQSKRSPIPASAKRPRTFHVISRK